MTAEDIVSSAVKAGLSHVAITDHHSLSCVPRFMSLCESAGIQGIVGVTLNVFDDTGSCGEFVLLAKNEDGFHQIKSMLETYGHVTQEKSYDPKFGVPRDIFLHSDFHQKTKECLLLDGFPGSYAEQELNRIPQQERRLSVLKTLLYDKSFSLSKILDYRQQGHYQAVYTPGYTSALALAFQSLQDSSPQTAPLLVNSFISYGANEAQMIAAQKAFLLYAKDWYAQFPDQSQVKDHVIQRYVGKIFPANITSVKGLDGAVLPHDYIEYFSGYTSTHSKELRVGALDKKVETPDSLIELVADCWNEKKHDIEDRLHERYESQLDEELRVIKNLKFDNYFLNLYQFKKLSDQDGNKMMLRGSAVGSLTLYVMGLTPVNPIEEGLLFRRFLNEDRLEEPDVDMEFVDSGKMHKLINTAFGSGKVAMLQNESGLKSEKHVSKRTTLLTLAKEAMLDLYSLDNKQRSDIEKAFKLLNERIFNGKRKVSWEDFVGELKLHHVRLLDDPTTKHLFDIADSLNRVNVSVQANAGGMVVIPEGVGQYFNILGKMDDGVPIIPFNKHSLPGSGIIKYDLLANRAFTRLVLGLRNAGLSDDPDVLHNDPSISVVSLSGSVLGVSQLNGYIGERLSNIMRPSTLQEITSLVAVIRSGDANEKNSTVINYLKGRSQPETQTTPAPLKPILDETYGVMVYEEQLLRILTEVVGQSWSDADKFRSSLKKGKFEVIDENEPAFIESVSRRFSLSKEEAEQWYKPFKEQRGRFLFAKAHSAAYSRLIVQQCWFKTHYPAHYAVEIFLDSKVVGTAPSGEGGNKNAHLDPSLASPIADWEKLVKFGFPQKQGGKAFINALGKALIREWENPTTGYKSNLPSLKAKIESFIDNDGFSGVQLPNENKEILKEHWLKAYERLSNYAPGAPSRHSAPSHHSVNKVVVNIENATAVPVPLSKDDYLVDEQDNDDDSKLSLNQLMQRDGDNEPWLNKVMFTQLLPYLANRGIVTILEEDLRKSASHVETKFILNKTREKYSIVSYACDQSRLNDRCIAIGLHTGFHQGRVGEGKAKYVVSDFFFEICKKKEIENAPPLKNIHDANKFFRQFVLSSPITLDGTHNIQAKQSLSSSISVPLPLDPGGISLAYADFKKCVVDRRGFLEDRVKHYVDLGLFTFCLKHHDQGRESKYGKGGYRGKNVSILANYRAVEPGQNLARIPFSPMGYISDGGHQRIYEEVNKDGKTKVMKRDHGTNLVKGHFWGEPIEGANVLWLTEGVFDAIGFNEIQHFISKVAPDVSVAEPNCIALKSVSGVKPFFEKMFDVMIKDGDDAAKRPYDFAITKSRYEGEAFLPSTLEGHKTFLSDHVFHIVHDNTPESEYVVHLINTFYQQVGLAPVGGVSDKIKVYFSNDNQWLKAIGQIAEGEASHANAILLHKGNVSHWMRANNLAFFSDENGKPVVGLNKRVREVIVPSFNALSESEKQSYRQDFNKIMRECTGAKGFGSAFDGDKAGLIANDQIINFCKLAGIPCFTVTQPEFKYPCLGEEMLLNDQNDYYNAMRRLHQAGHHEALHVLIDKYARGNTYHPRSFAHNVANDLNLVSDVKVALQR